MKKILILLTYLVVFNSCENYSEQVQNILKPGTKYSLVLNENCSIKYYRYIFLDENDHEWYIWRVKGSTLNVVHSPECPKCKHQENIIIEESNTSGKSMFDW